MTKLERLENKLDSLVKDKSAIDEAIDLVQEKVNNAQSMVDYGKNIYHEDWVRELNYYQSKKSILLKISYEYGHKIDLVCQQIEEIRGC